MDVGSGDGRACILAAREFGCRSIGIECNPFLVWFSRQRVRRAGLESRVFIKKGDAFKEDFSQADVLFLFLLQETNEKLEKKLKSELRPGSRVLSYCFTLPSFPETRLPEPRHHLYRIPGKMS